MLNHLSQPSVIDKTTLQQHNHSCSQKADSDIHFTQQKKTKNREVWIDVTRGITMLLVLYSHAILYSTGEGTSSLNAIFLTSRMPLFFFISGFFLYNIEYDLILLKKRLKNRLYKQLYPTIILFSLFIIIFCGQNFNLIFTDAKAGYWFTYVSVLYFLTLTPLFVLFSKLKLKRNSRILILFILSISSVPLYYLAYHTDFYMTTPSKFLSLMQFMLYFRFIAFGCIFRILWNDYNNRLINKVGFLVALVGFIICFSSKISILSYATGFFGIYIILFTIYKLSHYFTNNFILNWLSNIGSLTLEIYLLHYFIICSVLPKFQLFQVLKMHFLNTYWEFPIYICLSIVIAVVCLLIVKLLRHLKIYKYIFAKEWFFLVDWGIFWKFAVAFVANRGLLANDGAADDALQEAFYKLWARH